MMFKSPIETESYSKKETKGIDGKDPLKMDSILAIMFAVCRIIDVDG